MKRLLIKRRTALCTLAGLPAVQLLTDSGSARAEQSPRKVGT